MTDQEPQSTNRHFDRKTVDVLGFLQEARCALHEIQAAAGRSVAGRKASILLTETEKLLALTEFYGQFEQLVPPPPSEIG